MSSSLGDQDTNCGLVQLPDLCHRSASMSRAPEHYKYVLCVGKSNIENWIVYVLYFWKRSSENCMATGTTTTDVDWHGKVDQPLLLHQVAMLMWLLVYTALLLWLSALAAHLFRLFFLIGPDYLYPKWANLICLSIWTFLAQGVLSLCAIKFSLYKCSGTLKCQSAS